MRRREVATPSLFGLLRRRASAPQHTSCLEAVATRLLSASRRILVGRAARRSDGRSEDGVRWAAIDWFGLRAKTNRRAGEAKAVCRLIACMENTCAIISRPVPVASPHLHGGAGVWGGRLALALGSGFRIDFRSLPPASGCRSCDDPSC